MTQVEQNSNLKIAATQGQNKLIDDNVCWMIHVHKVIIPNSKNSQPSKTQPGYRLRSTAKQAAI